MPAPDDQQLRIRTTRQVPIASVFSPAFVALLTSFVGRAGGAEGGVGKLKRYADFAVVGLIGLVATLMDAPTKGRGCAGAV